MAETKSKRQRIIDALDTRINAILTTGGYKTNLGSKNYPFRSTPVEESEMPACLWKDTVDERKLETFGEEEHYLSVIFLFFAKGADAAAQARNMIGDVTRAVWTDITFGGLAEMTEEDAPNEMDTQQKEYFNAVAAYKLKITYTTAIGDPEYV